MQIYGVGSVSDQNKTEQQLEADRILADMAANAAKAHWHQANDRAALLQQNKSPDQWKTQ